MNKIKQILFTIFFLVISCNKEDECTNNASGNPTIVFTNNKNFTIGLSYNNYAKNLLPGEEYRVTFIPAGKTLSYVARAGSKSWSDSFELESCTFYDVQFK